MWCCSARLEDWEQQKNTPSPDCKACDSDGGDTHFSSSVSCSLQSSDSESDSDTEDEVDSLPIPNTRPTFVPKLILNQSLPGKTRHHDSRNLSFLPYVDVDEAV